MRDHSTKALIRECQALGLGVKKLLTSPTGQPKLLKSLLRKDKSGKPIYTDGLMLAPASTSGINVCRWSTVLCRKHCLTYSGQGGIGLVNGLNNCQRARINRTLLWAKHPDLFFERLDREIKRSLAYCEKHGFVYALRPNVLSDIQWEHTILPGILMKPEIRSYDYTKAKPSDRKPWKGYHLTYSHVSSLKRSQAILDAGKNVAVVFDVRKGQALPKTWLGYRTIDADKHDARLMDRGPVVVGLRAKGWDLVRGLKNGSIRTGRFFQPNRVVDRVSTASLRRLQILS